jgi:isopenicillin N synthase-like dioxygenase
MRSLTERVTALLATALDLPAEDLPSWTSRQFSNLVVNHYLPQVTEPEPGRVRQKPHTDHGGLTLLWADGRAGLEAAIGPDGAWVPVSFPPNSILLQAGDLLHLWSRGLIPANMHRVVNPPRESEDAQAERYSVVFFHHPDLDTWVAPGGDATTGVNARDYVMARQKVSYSLD